jgi:hypothetical protein
LSQGHILLEGVPGWPRPTENRCQSHQHRISANSVYARSSSAISSVP